MHLNLFCKKNEVTMDFTVRNCVLTAIPQNIKENVA